MNRSHSHWSIRYLFNRAVEKTYRLFHPRLPWLSPKANRMLKDLLKPTFQGLEFGSGRSTLWFAKHLNNLISFEHNPEWYGKVSALLTENNLSNVAYFLKPREQDKEPDGIGTDYIKSIDSLSDLKFDFILVDGVYRAECANHVLPKIKPGGMLVIDNANLYLPCKSYSPNSRTEKTGPASPRWADFLDSAKGWNVTWTSNGVSDTVFFFKPS